MMKRFFNFKKGSLLMAAFLFSACTFTVNNDLVKSHPEEVEAYIQNIFEAFYDENTDYILAQASDGVNFTEDAMIGLYEVSHETAQPDYAEIVDRGFTQQNATKYYVSLFHIPRERGRETLKLTVTPDGDDCCELYGLYLNMQLGPDFIMDVTEQSAPQISSPTNG